MKKPHRWGVTLIAMSVGAGVALLFPELRSQILVSALMIWGYDTLQKINDD